MTEPASVPSYRLKLPCADEHEFREKFLQKYVSRGVFVPSDRPKPVGTRLRLKLEIKGGAVLVHGEGMVTTVTAPGGTGKSGMTVRLTGLLPDSIQFSLSPSGNGAVSAPAPSAGVAAAPQPPAAAPPIPPPAIARTTPVPPPRPAPPPVVQAAPRPPVRDDLFDFDEEPDAGAPAHAATDEGVMAITDPAIPIPDFVEPDAILSEPSPTAPTPPPTAAPVAPPVVGARRRAALSRRMVILMAAGALVAVAMTAAGVATSRSNRAKKQVAARVDEQLRLADLRLLEGRLAGAGGESALDHLLEAKGLAPTDERVVTRLKLLADKFEQLGDRALARKNAREAAVHFKATLLADPARAKAREKLDDIAAKAPGAAPR